MQPGIQKYGAIVAVGLISFIAGGVAYHLAYGGARSRNTESDRVERDLVDSTSSRASGVAEALTERIAATPSDVVVSEGPATQEPGELTPEQFELQVRAGLISRSEIGDERVDDVLRRRARTVLAELPSSALLDWRAKQLGFRGVEEMERFEGQLDSLPAVDRQEFEHFASVVDEALAVYQECRMLAFDNGRNLEVVDPENRHDTDEWVRGRGLDDTTGSRLANTADMWIGDRIFRLYFRSAEYPELESRMERIEQLRRGFKR